MISKAYIQQLAADTSILVKEIREHLHRYPELSFNEHQTLKFIAEKLKNWNIEHALNIGGGILAKIEGKTNIKNIGLRADIDALPIKEKNQLSYCSQNEGIMHACGHDFHTASLLGTLYILNQLKNELNGTVWGFFQPAEEKLPGGAINMLNHAIVKSIPFDYMIAQHVYPELPAGFIGVKSGAYMASTDEIYITLKGKGGHAATPHKITDTVLIASQIVIALQQIVSRKAKPTIPTVLSFGKFIANGATNIIPDEVELEGTFRTFDENWRKEALELLKKYITQLAQTFGIEASVRIVNGYPSLFNNEHLAEHLKTYAKEYLGNNNVIDLEMRMTAEDFSYFAQRYPSVLYRIGTGGTPETEYPLHSANFNINEKVYSFSHGLMAWICINLLQNDTKI